MTKKDKRYILGYLPAKEEFPLWTDDQYSLVHKVFEGYPIPTSLKKYKISLEEYLTYLIDQGCLCGICGVLPEKDSVFDLDLDRNGQIRGLLCKRCSTKLSVIEDGTFMYLAKMYLGQEKE